MGDKQTKTNQKKSQPIDRDGILKKYAMLTNKTIILIKKIEKTEDEMWALFDILNDIELLNDIVRDEIR